MKQYAKTTNENISNGRKQKVLKEQENPKPEAKGRKVQSIKIEENISL